MVRLCPGGACQKAARPLLPALRRAIGILLMVVVAPIVFFGIMIAGVALRPRTLMPSKGGTTVTAALTMLCGWQIHGYRRRR